MGIYYRFFNKTRKVINKLDINSIGPNVCCWVRNFDFISYDEQKKIFEIVKNPLDKYYYDLKLL